MTNFENQESREISMDELFSKLENSENLASHQLEKIEYSFNEASPENIELCTSIINEICANDEGIKEKGWDFLKTLEKIKLETV
ncbi:MAG: hypothetical protein Q8K30_02350 [Candidatus Gracilibacteria bacterium]|nr:hypothetical protein [Candidatus Gracilibacteria bacterium]